MYMVYIVLIELWTRSPKRKLKIGRLEVFLNAYAGFINLGKSENSGNSGRFYEKSKCLKKKKNLPLHFRIIF